MTNNEFWDIIKKGKNANNDIAKFNKIIQFELEKLSINELITYQQILYKLFQNAYTWDLWNAADIIEGGCGDDSFMDFRASLISLGKEIYENTMKNPDFFASLDEEKISNRIYNESFLNLGVQIYEEKTSKYIYDEFNFISNNEPTGEKINFEDKNIENKLKIKYPKLMEKYW